MDGEGFTAEIADCFVIKLQNRVLMSLFYAATFQALIPFASSLGFYDFTGCLHREAIVEASNSASIFGQKLGSDISSRGPCSSNLSRDHMNRCLIKLERYAHLQ